MGAELSAEQMSPEQMSRSIYRGAFVAFFGAIVGGAFCHGTPAGLGLGYCMLASGSGKFKPYLPITRI